MTNFKSNIFKVLIIFSIIYIVPINCKNKEKIDSDNKIDKLRSCMIHIFNKTNEKIVLNTEIADNDETRSYGLMFRKKLDENCGMIFVFPKEGKLNFWMKNTYITLSIAYIDQYGVILEQYDMKPLDDTITYPSKYKVKYALEVNKGWFEKNKIVIGSKLEIDGCISK